MAISHKEIVVPDDRFATPLFRPPVEGNEFAENIVTPDPEVGGLSFELEVLRGFPDGREGEEGAALPNFGPAVNANMGFNPGSFPDSDVLSYDAVRPDLNIVSDLGVGMDDTCTVDHREKSFNSVKCVRHQ
jgi:hypothetical protein